VCGLEARGPGVPAGAIAFTDMLLCRRVQGQLNTGTAGFQPALSSLLIDLI